MGLGDELFEFGELFEFQGTMCCQYGTDGLKIATAGYDCFLIPGAQKPTNGAAVAPKLCGTQMGLVSIAGTTQVTICCK